MGIPHLIAHLRPFASIEEFSDRKVVIDGPGLAYHIYHACLSSKPCARNPFEAIPSLELVGETTLSWLEKLQISGVTLMKIYFDGYLPFSKRETRSSRLTNYTKQLSDYHQARPQIIPSSQLASQTLSVPEVKLFDTDLHLSKFPKLPATPFLVPAVLESLLRHENYENITEVVPGEADAFCAQYVKFHGGTVLTSDSDLLVHDLGGGSVVFLRDIGVVETNRGKSFNCVEYNVSSIVDRLGLPSSHGIRSLAFEMLMDVHGSFRQLLQQATQSKAITIHEKLYEEFSKEYASLPEEIMSQKSVRKEDNMLLLSSLKMLDPRVSEYVLQFPIFAEAAGLSETMVSRDKLDFDMFLPFLLDCPNRTSGWEMSTPVRQLAYSLVNLVLPEKQMVATVMEHRRHQSGNKGREWELPAQDAIPAACDDVVKLIYQIREHMQDKTELKRWRAYAFHQDAILANRDDKVSLGDTIMARSRDSKVSPLRLTWDGIHFSAQLEGSHYSFRILKQILSLVLACDNNRTPEILLVLQRELETLPYLRDIPSPTHVICQLNNSEDKTIWAMVWKMLNLIEKDAIPIALSTNKERKKRKLDAIRAGTIPQKANTNIYELLGNG